MALCRGVSWCRVVVVSWCRGVVLVLTSLALLLQVLKRTRNKFADVAEYFFYPLLRVMDSSYEISCADARTPPRNGYFELEAQPAKIKA